MSIRVIFLASLLSLVAFAAEQSGQEPRESGVRTTFVCTARSLTGRRYSATGTDQVLTQEAAMQQCGANSWRCYPTGCQSDR